MIVNPQLNINSIWTAEITDKCGLNALNEAFMSLSFLQTSQVALGFGAYYGCVVQSYFFQGQSLMAEPESGALCKTAVRALVMMLLTLPGILFYGLNYIGVNNKVFLLIFAQILPHFLVPFTPFAVGDSLNLKIGFLDEAQSKEKGDKSIEINDSEEQGYLSR